MINNVKYYGGAAVGEKGQIIIPAEVRRDLAFKQGTICS